MQITNSIIRLNTLSFPLTDFSSIFETRKDVSLHCDEKGNFETVQCDNGLCWCMEGGSSSKGRLKATSKVLHENLMEQLPCYLKNHKGKAYLRRCESRTVSKARVKAKMARHNLDWRERKDEQVFCDYDGSFAPKNRDTTKTFR